jgi:hypothetical protein
MIRAGTGRVMMSDDMIANEALGLDDLHEEVAELDAKIAAATKDEMSDSEKASLEKLIEERNEAFKRNYVAASE